MSTEKQKPLLYIVPTESVSLQETVTSAITNVTDLDENNQINSSNSKLLLTKKVAMVAAATALDLILPFPLTIASAVIADIITQKKDTTNNDSSQNKESKPIDINNLKQNNNITADVNKVLKSLDLENWSAFVAQMPYSFIPEDFEFSPGHPLPGRFYRAHPLKSKTNKYIPIETFDSLLYAEREAELIRLLVDLGATKIAIQEKQLGKIESEATANMAIAGTGGVKAESKRDGNNLNESIRSFSLGGINWSLELQNKFDKTSYSWLPYEPAWDAVVHARLYGKCLTASIELTNDNSYSISGKLGLTEGLLQNLGGFDAGGSLTRNQTKTSQISVEFAPSIEI